MLPRYQSDEDQRTQHGQQRQDAQEPLADRLLDPVVEIQSDVLF
jgi:hypothetical protein